MKIPQRFINSLAHTLASHLDAQSRSMTGAEKRIRAILRRCEDDSERQIILKTLDFAVRRIGGVKVHSNGVTDWSYCVWPEMLKRIDLDEV